MPTDPARERRVDRVVRFLSAERCLELLGTVGLGRVAVTRHGVPHVVPVNHCVVDGHVLFRSGVGTKHDAALFERPVAFEADRFDEDERLGWSVLVSGPAELVREPAEIERAVAAGLRSWVAGEADDVVRIRPDLVSGRELVPVSS